MKGNGSAGGSDDYLSGASARLEIREVPHRDPEEFDGEGFATPSSRVLVYYGAADTCIGVATATVAELVRACRDS